MVSKNADNSLSSMLWEECDTDLPTARFKAAALGYQLFPNDAGWATQYGSAALIIGRDVEAERALLAAHPIRKHNREHVEWLLGEVYAHQGRFQEAEKWFRMATVTAPSKTGPWVYLGGFLANRQRFAEACEVLEQGLHATGDVDEVYLNLGLNKRALNDLEGARECFEAALAIDPGYEEAKFSLRDIQEAIRIRDQFGPLVKQQIQGH